MLPYSYSSYFKLLCFYGFFVRLSNCYVDSIASFILELLMAFAKSSYMMYLISPYHMKKKRRENDGDRRENDGDRLFHTL